MSDGNFEEPQQPLLSDSWALTRERRTGALCAWFGRLADLSDLLAAPESHQRIRTFAQGGFDDILAAIRALGAIRDSAIIIHGAIGCASGAPALLGPGRAARLYSTSLSERASIMGGEEPLRKTIERARTEGPAKAIFVLGAPVTAINNDDAASVIMELQQDDSKIIFIPVDGVRSKTFASGFDTTAHCLLSGLVESAGGEPKEPLLALVAMSETTSDIAEILGLLQSFGIKAVALPRLGSVQNLVLAGCAQAAVALDPQEGGYLVQGLAETFGVTPLKAPVPVGFDAISIFVQKTLETMGLAGLNAVSKALAAAKEAVTSSKASGAKVFLSGSLPLVASMAEAVRDLGGTISGAAVAVAEKNLIPELDRLISVAGEAIEISVGAEPFEIANIIFKTKADILIGGPVLGPLARAFGAVHLSTARTSFYGYGGLIKLAKGLSAALEIPRSKPTGRPYRAAWLNKPGNWHVKLETT